MERKQLAPGVCITTLDASKFNRCRITLHLRFPARRESATDAAVLALVLERGYAACPDMTALSRRLAELYGADLGVDLASAGTDRVLSADICGIKDAYALAGENLTAAYADIVFGTIFDPYLVDGAFDPEAVRIETETQARRLEAEFNSKRLYCVRQARRKFYGDTPAGIELGAALKNVIALCAGVCAGMGFGDNTKALLMTRGLAEVARLGMALGAHRETFAGLAGVGDLIVTCTSMHSRNRRAGILIGLGVPVQEARKQVGAVVEGYYAAQSAWELAQRKNVDMPLTEAAYAVLYEGRDPREALNSLMLRDRTSEAEDAAWAR